MNIKPDIESEKIIKEIIANVYQYHEIAGIFNSLMQYAEMVMEWNDTHNIISRNLSIVDVLENICDSIFIVKFFSKEFFYNGTIKNIVDVGSGGGFPGIPLAILFPEKDFILIDSNRKKCSFLRNVKSKLNLINISVLNKRFDASLLDILVVTKAAISPANFSVIIDGLSEGGNAIIWATPKTKPEFMLEMDKLGGKITEEHEFTLPSGKARLFLLITK